MAMLLEHPKGMNAIHRAELRYARAYRRYLKAARILEGIAALRTAYRARNR